jgi:hypothetical protein
MVYLTIGGNDLDDRVVITSISATFGRQTITEQPSPATFNCTFVLGEKENLTKHIEPGDAISWYIEDFTLPYPGKVIAFYGLVSDVNIRLNWKNGHGLFEYQITGVDPSSKLSNVLITSSFAKQNEGTRIAAVLTAASFYDGGIDTPGDYELAMHAAGKTDALTLCQQAANSGMGYLYYDFRQGFMSYQTYLNRKSNPLIALTISDVLAGDFTLTSSINTVANQITVNYNSGSGTVYNDTYSQGVYGKRSGTKDTVLHNAGDATTQAQIYGRTRNIPKFRLQTVTINSAALSDVKMSQMANLNLGDRITIDGLPTPDLESFTGFVEGYTRTKNVYQDIITLQLSSYGDFYPYTLWNDLNNTDTWNSYATSTTQWRQIN